MSSIIKKSLGLLTAIGESGTPMSFTQLAVTTGYNKSTTHRLLTLLKKERLVQYDDVSRTYLLGPKLFELVRRAHEGYDIQAVALEEMIRLYKLTNRNITLGVLEGNEVVYLRLLEADQPWRGMTRPRMRVPIHCSASGKVLTAYLEPELISARLKNYRFARKTKRTIVDAAKFQRTLARVRKLGYATNDREEYDHLVGISAPVFNYTGDVIAALNVWSISTESSLEELVAWAPELMASSKKITELLGGHSPGD